MRRFFLAFMLIFIAFSAKVYATDINALKDLIAKGSEIVFKFETFSKENKSLMSYSGNAKVLGDKYLVKLDSGMSVISDGKSVWIINEETSETIQVEVDSDSNSEDVLLNPFVLLNNPPANIKFDLSGVIKPSDSDKSVPATISVSGFDNLEFSKLVINILSVSDLKDKSVEQFTFDKGRYPSMNVVDLR